MVQRTCKERSLSFFLDHLSRWLDRAVQGSFILKSSMLDQRRVIDWACLYLFFPPIRVSRGLFGTQPLLRNLFYLLISTVKFKINGVYISSLCGLTWCLYFRPPYCAFSI
jgi:hypothetical protein